jgi:hypothetical protein
MRHFLLGRPPRPQLTLAPGVVTPAFAARLVLATRGEQASTTSLR